MTHENQFTPRAEEALRLAQEAAEEMGHGYVGCEHILLGLMREEDGIAHLKKRHCRQIAFISGHEGYG